jgi:hypothetical protein
VKLNAEENRRKTGVGSGIDIGMSIPLPTLGRWVVEK